jgi:hypothetical protein
MRACSTLRLRHVVVARRSDAGAAATGEIAAAGVGHAGEEHPLTTNAPSKT